MSTFTAPPASGRRRLFQRWTRALRMRVSVDCVLWLAQSNPPRLQSWRRSARFLTTRRERLLSLQQPLGASRTSQSSWSTTSTPGAWQLPGFGLTFSPLSRKARVLFSLAPSLHRLPDRRSTGSTSSTSSSVRMRRRRATRRSPRRISPAHLATEPRSSSWPANGDPRGPGRFARHHVRRRRVRQRDPARHRRQRLAPCGRSLRYRSTSQSRAGVGHSGSRAADPAFAHRGRRSAALCEPRCGRNLYRRTSAASDRRLDVGR